MGFNNNANNANAHSNYDQRLFLGANQTSSGSQSGSSMNDISFFSQRQPFSMTNAVSSTPSTPTNMNNSGMVQAGDVYNMMSPSF